MLFDPGPHTAQGAGGTFREAVWSASTVLWPGVCSKSQSGVASPAGSEWPGVAPSSWGPGRRVHFTPTRETGGSVPTLLTSSQPWRAIVRPAVPYAGCGPSVEVSRKATVRGSMGPACVAAAGKDPPLLGSQVCPEALRPGVRGWGCSLAHGQSSECLGTPDGEE